MTSVVTDAATDRDQVRDAKGLVLNHGSLRQVPQRLPPRNRPSRKRNVMAINAERIRTLSKEEFTFNVQVPQLMHSKRATNSMTNENEDPEFSHDFIKTDTKWWLDDPSKLRPGMRFWQEGKGITLIHPVFGSRRNSWYGKYDGEPFTGMTAVLSSFERQLEPDPEAEIFALEQCEIVLRGRSDLPQLAELVFQLRLDIEKRRE